jgi:selenocysteine lyase/cysteine desulfurase
VAIFPLLFGTMRSMITDETLAEWRAQTPGCTHRVHLNNAGAALMPAPVLAAMSEHLSLEAELGGYEAADMRAAAIEQTYANVAALINAQPRNVAIVANATAGFIQALSSFDLKPGDSIVTTRSDYTSYQIQYLSLSKRLGIRVVHAEDLPEGGVDPDSVRRLAADSRCRLVHVSWVPTHSGLVQDVASVGSVCQDLGVPYLVDACQAAGQIPIDVDALRCDYLSVTARKFLRGPRGVGFLYASDRALARGDHPLFVDMRGATWTGPNSYALADSAIRYEDWEFPYALVLGLAAAARYAQFVGVDVAQERAWSLAAELRTQLSSIPGARVLDPGRVTCAIVTAAIDGCAATDLVAALRERRINSAASLRWYGLLDFTARDVTSAIRLSPHYYNTTDEIAIAVDAIRDLASSSTR